MNVEAFISGFVSSLGLWVSILLVASAWNVAKRIFR